MENNNNKQDNLKFKEEAQNLLKNINILEIIYNLSIGILLRQSAKRRFISYIYIKTREENGEEAKIAVSLLLVALNLFILDIIFLFTLLPSSIVAYLVAITVLNVVVTLIYKVSNEFTAKQFLNVARETLKDNSQQMTFKENYIYYRTPLLLLEYADLLNEYLTSNLTSTRKTKADKYNFEIIEPRYSRLGTQKRQFLEAIESYLGKESILQIRVRDNLKRDRITSLADYPISHFKILPRRVANQLTAVDHSIILADAKAIIDEESNLRYFDLLKSEYASYIKEYAEIAEQEAKLKAEHEEKQRRKQEKANNEKIKNELMEKYNNKKVVKALLFLYADSTKEMLNAYPRDLFRNGIEATDDYLKVRMNLNSDASIANVKKQLSTVENGTGLNVKVLENQENRSVFSFFFKLNNNLKSRHMNYEEVAEEGKQGIITIGKGYLGDYKVKIPTQDAPFFALVGGLSRSGKSTLATRLLLNTIYMEYEDGEKVYEDYFISSVKDEDYTANSFKDKGMMIVNNPIDTLNMLRLVDRIGYERKEFLLKYNMINIKQYNKKSDKKMSKIMVVMDEYANLLRSADSLVIEEDGKKVKVREAIENLITKINMEHGSRGINSIIITQNFSKSEVGKVRDSVECLILGYNAENVWSSYDNSGEIGKLLKTKEDNIQGIFLMNSRAFEPTKGTKSENINGFVELKTHFIDTDEIRSGLTADDSTNYDTAIKYAKDISKQKENEILIDDEDDDFL